MLRLPLALVLVVILAASPGPGQDKDTKPFELKSDFKRNVFVTAADGGRDFALQGEFAGTLGSARWAAQVVAKGDGKFDIYFLAGGLPGAGWDRSPRTKVVAQTAEGKSIFDASGWKGTLEANQLQGTKDGAPFRFERVNRTSPSAGAKPPQGATVLFDGASVEQWNRGKLVDGKYLFAGTNLKTKPRLTRLHIEFRTPFQPKAGGQGRGNSGVYLNGDEIQVLDSFGLEGKNNECGGFYSRRAPAVNMCLPPLVWQTYDVELTSADGKLLATVEHNGVKIHDRYALGSRADAGIAINLQNHGNPVIYRNIWIVEQK